MSRVYLVSGSLGNRQVTLEVCVEDLVSMLLEKVLRVGLDTRQESGPTIQEFTESLHKLLVIFMHLQS